MIIQDNPFPAKLYIFLMVALEITPFLKLYETGKPMLQHMIGELYV